MDKELDRFRHELASNPDDADALARLEAALLKAGDWEGLVALTDNRAKGASEEDAVAAWVRLVEGLSAFAADLPDPKEVSRVAVITARVCEERLGELEEALIRYEQAFQIDPTNIEALGQARRIYAGAERYDMVFELLNVELGAVGTPRAQADLYLQLADVCLNHLDRRTDATVCVRQALKLVPDHPGAAPFSSLISDVQQNRRAQIDELLAAAQGARDPRQRTALQLEAAGFMLEDAPADPALEALMREVLERDPRNEPARILLEQHFEAAQRFDALLAWLDERAEATARKPDRLALFQRAADVALRQLGDEEVAVRYHRKVLELDPVDAVSLNFCVDVFSETERWGDLVQVYEAALRVRHRVGEEGPMLVQIAMILWKKLEDLDGAEAYFRRIKLNDPRNGLMLSFYVDFYRAKDDPKRLLATLQAQQQAVNDDARKVEIGLEMARVAELDTANLQKAVDIWKALLKLQNDHPEGRAALRRLYTETGKWNALLEFLKEDLQILPRSDREGRLAIYRQVIEIYRDRMKLPRMVITTWNELLEEDPNNSEALDALESSAEARSKYNELIEVLDRRVAGAAAVGDAAEQIKQLKRVADLWLEKFSNAAKAREALEAVLEVDASEPEALDRLVEIYKQRKDWRALYNAWRRRLNTVTGPARTSLLAEMAGMAADKLDAPAEAVALWRQVLQADPERDEARDALEALLHQQRAWANLVTLYRERVARTEGALQLPWLRKLGTVLAEHSGDLAGAADVWRAVLAQDPRDGDAERFLREQYLARGDWDALEALYLDRGQPAALAKLLRAGIDATPDRAQRIRLLERLARLAEESLQDEGAAVATWERLLAEDPTHVAAAQRLSPHYGHIGAWADQVRCLEVLLGAAPADPLSLMVELARVHEERLAQPEVAWGWRQQALAQAPTRADLLVAARQTAESAGRQAELAQTLAAAVEGLSATEAVPLRRTLAALYADDLGRPADAVEVQEALRATLGDTPEVLEELEALYQRLERWDDLLAIYEQRLAAAPELADQTAILTAMGELHETVRDDVPAAREAFERIRALDPGHLDALRGLQRLARQADDLEGLAGYLEAELALAREPAAVAEIRNGLGQLAEDLGQYEEALTHYRQALAAVLDHPPTIQALERLLDAPVGPLAASIIEPRLRRTQAWDALRRVLALQVEGTADADRRAELLREIAELEEGRLGQPAAAFGTWQRLLVQRRSDALVRAHLERLAASLGRFDELVEHYARFGVGGPFAADDPDLAVAYSRLVAGLQEEHLNQHAAARATLEAVLVETGDDRVTLDALDRLTTRLEDWRGLVEVGERRLALIEDPTARREIFSRIADLWDEVLGSAEDAVSTWRRLLAEQPQDERAFRALEALLRRLERFHDVADLLRGRLVEAGEGPAYRALALELAALLQIELSAPAEAVELYAEVLAADSDDEAAADALQMMLVEHDGPESQGLRARISEILEPIYVLRGDWQSRVHLLQVRLNDEHDARTRADIGVQVARLYEEQAGDAQAAFASYGAAFGEVWGDAEILGALERLAAQLNAYGDLAWHLRRGLDGDAAASAEPAVRHALIERVAVLYEEKVGDFGLAIEFNRRLLAEVPEDDAALARLDRLYDRLGDGEAQARVLEQRALYAEPTERRALALRLARLLEDLGTPARAVAVYQQIREDAETPDLPVLEALERLHAAAGDHEALVVVLNEHAEALEGAARRPLLMQAASVLETHLGRPGEAVEIYRQVRSLDPEDTVLDHLERLLTQLEQPLDLLEVLEAKRELAQEPGARADVDLRIGRLFHTVLGEPARAVEAYQAVLAVRPTDAMARQALTALLDDADVRLEVGSILAGLYEAEGSWEALRDVLQRTLADRDEPADQVATLRRIAGLEELRLGNPGAALEALATAWRIDEASPSLEPELVRLAEQAQRLSDLVDLYIELAPHHPERTEALRLEAARLAEVRLNDAERAIDQLRAVLAFDPENGVALEGLDRLLSQTGDAEGLAQVLALQADRAPDAERRGILVRLAELQEGLLDDQTAAIDTWRRVLSEDEADGGALNQLERLLGAQGRFAELSGLLEHRVGIESDAARPAVLVRLAHLLERSLGEGERALDLYRRVIEAEPGNTEARRALGALFAEPARAEALGLDRAVVASVLEPCLRRENSPAELVEVLEIIQENSMDDPEARARCLEEIATLREQRLGQTKGALEARGRLLRIEPEATHNRTELLRLAGATYQWDAAAALFEEVAADVVDPTLRMDLLLALARIEETQRGQDGRAVAVYREVLSIDPECQPAVDALVELFGRNAAWDDLVRLHLDRAESTHDPDLQKELYFKTCQLLEEVVGDRERAITVYRQVLEIDPDDTRARGALQRFFRQDGRWHELADLLREEIEQSADPDARADLRLKLAEVLEGRLEDADGAVGAWQGVLEEEAAHPDLRGKAVENLEHILLDTDEGTEARRLRVAELLEPIYRDAGQWSDLLLVLDVRLEAETDRWQRLEAQGAIATIQEEKLGDAAAAFASWSRAFAEAPGHEDAQVALRRLAARLGAWQALADAFLAGALGADDPDTTLELLAEVGEVRETRLNDQAGAIEAWRRVLGVDDTHTQALDALERLLDARGDAQGLVIVLARKADAASDPQVRRTLRHRIGQIQEEVIQSSADAIDAWRVVFEEDPADLRAIDALTRLYEAGAQWPQVIEMLREKQDLVESEAHPLLVRIAHIQETHLQATDEAIVTWRSVLELDAGDDQALTALERLYTSEARWGELLDLLETRREALRTKSPAQADAVAIRMADVLANHLDQRAQVVEIYGEILERKDSPSPEAEAARQALEALLADPEHRLAAARVLETWYTERDAFSALARILEIELLDLEDRHDRLDLQKRLGTLLRDTLGKGKEAFAVFGKALAEDPADAEVITALEGLTESLGLHPELADLYEGRVAEILEPSQALDLHRRLARLVDSRLGSATRAISAWQAVLGDEPFDAEALTALERLYTAEEDWTALMGVLRRRIEEGTAPDLADLQCKLGYLLEAVDGDVPAAIELYRTVLWDKADHPEALAAVERLAGDLDHRGAVVDVLEPLYREAEQWAKLALLTEMRIELASEGHERARLWLQSAELREERLSDPTSAFEALLRGFAEQPDSEEVRERLLRLGASLEAWPRLILAFEQGLTHLQDPDSILEDRLRLAQWSLRQGDVARAVGHYRAVLGIEPGHTEAQDALEALFRDRADWPALAELVARRVEQTFDLDIRRARLMELGHLRADKLGDAAGAAAAWQQVLAIEDADAEALAALENLHRGAGDWSALVGVLTRRVETTYEDDALIALNEQIGSLALDQLGDGPRAAEAFERVLEIEPDRRSVLVRLEALYLDLADWPRLQEVLHKALEAAGDDEAERLRVLVLQAQNAENNLGRPESAMEAWRQALAIDPTDARAFDHLAALYAQAERHYDLAEVLREHIAAVRPTATPERRVALLVQLAEVAEGKLRDADLAIECLTEVLETHPAHGGARLVLAGLHEQAGDWEQAAEALERVAADADTALQRGTAWRRLGMLYQDRLARPQAAVEAFEKALQESGDDGAVQALLTLARAEGDDHKVLKLLELRLNRLTGADRLPLLRELALVTGRLGEKAARITLLEEARTLAPGDLEVSEALIEALTDAGRLDEAEPRLRALIDELKAGRRFKELFRFNYQLGLLAEKRGDDAKALEAFTACFEFDATWLPNLMRLGRLYHRRADWQNALRIFQTALLHQAKLERDERAELFYLLGTVRLALEEPRKAKDMFSRALAQVPDHAPSQEALKALGGQGI
jgi:tetratricopeptide (TPR) repeat protein